MMPKMEPRNSEVCKIPFPFCWDVHITTRQWGTTKTPIYSVSTPVKFGGYSLPTKSWAPVTTCWFRKTHHCRITWPSCWIRSDWNASVNLKPCPLAAAKWDVSCCVWLQKPKMHQGRHWCWPLHIWKAPRIWGQCARVFRDQNNIFEYLIATDILQCIIISFINIFDFQVHHALCFFETTLRYTHKFILFW